MSLAHVLRIPLHFGDYFWVSSPKASSKLRTLERNFEHNLAKNLEKLQPVDISDVFTFRWIRLAFEIISEAHTHIKTLVIDLQLPVSDWDERCIDLYLDSSMKVLDTCNIFSAELNRLNQGQLLLRYVLHILTAATCFPSSEQLRRAHASLNDWLKKTNSRSTKLDNCHAILQTLRATLCLPITKTSAKGRVLMRALYGVGIMTLFTCSVIMAALTGSSRPLVDLHIADKFEWLETFNSLQDFLHEGIRRELSNGKVRMLKDIEALKLCAMLFDSLTNGIDYEEEPVQSDVDIKKDGSNSKRKYANPEERQRLQECIRLLIDGGQLLGNELDSFSKQVNHLFQLLLNGRDALLCNLRSSNITKRSTNETRLLHAC